LRETTRKRCIAIGQQGPVHLRWGDLEDRSGRALRLCEAQERHADRSGDPDFAKNEQRVMDLVLADLVLFLSIWSCDSCAIFRLFLYYLRIFTENCSGGIVGTALRILMSSE